MSGITVSRSRARSALALANAFNVLVAVYFIVIAIISLVQLRWYHQLTVTTRVRHVTTATSYSAFALLLVAAIMFIIAFIIEACASSARTYVSPTMDSTTATKNNNTSSAVAGLAAEQSRPISRESFRLKPDDDNDALAPPNSPDQQQHRPTSRAQRLVIRDATTKRSGGQRNFASLCCRISLHLIVSIVLIVILIVWLLNTGELVRESISSQLDDAFKRYQFANRSNRFSVAIDGMQDINNCCGSLDYTDFPRSPNTGLGSGHYPGSCCGKNIFGVNARVVCTPEEVVRAKQTQGCTYALASHYDLVSVLIVPVALASLLVNVVLIASITFANGQAYSGDNRRATASSRLSGYAPADDLSISGNLSRLRRV